MEEIIGNKILLRSYVIEDVEPFFKWRNDVDSRIKLAVIPA